ncbi:hypothetical protein FGD67_21395 [Colwellia sp. M166]|uniref:SOS response-associated peptidase family protein n=1 Tax=Colwellia sp. M166 TaxID=2583805 RepID=UPI00211F10A3|nr:SOS response-associated peptidase family protein [Colwellia sp. M166]UUO25487.1 hypothetical protein FGD67_21395 [Colwellia sp. M166]
MRKHMRILWHYLSALGNENLCPRQTVSTKINPNGNFHQLNTRWGRKSVRSKGLLINTQSETITKKQQYLYSNNEPFLMAGIWYQTPSEIPKLVTLTTSPNEKCPEYHKRMPVTVLPENTEY